MSKYRTVHKKDFVRPYKIHPIWRGIGLLIMIIIPIIAWAAAQELTTLALASEMPQIKSVVRSLSSPFGFPSWAFDVPYISNFARWIRSIPMLKMLLTLFFMIVLAFSGVLSIIYGIIYRMSVPLYGPLDEPAPKIRAKKYTR
ncbi:MAG: hypothetical protein CVU44_19800 [Chloroflexi bacterium HGW-Chloroflexi-6]|nr:MAG: hypothetical protein CVU44_19800 [Chloroflexi bacterium HGW-Chloroflexi-6]